MMRPLLCKWTARGTAEFSLRQPENLLLVKRERDGGLLVCATADNLSAEQQEAFARYLQAEGFAPGVFAPSGWFEERGADQEGTAVRWIVDPSWPGVDPIFAKHLRRLCWYLAGAVVVFLVLVTALICC